MKKVFLYFLVAVYVVATLSISGCANIIPPTGGPRDSLSPVLIEANPPDSTRQFAGGKIILTFDEFVELNKPQEQIIVSPVPKISPITDAKLRTVTIRIKDTLEPNTTYTVDFGNAIRDINEGNEVKNFRYIFTTGKYFDSLQFAGKVILAETGRPDSTLIVMLHKSLTDSAVAKEKPRYFARVDTAGNFQFRNLPPGKFAVYALKDEGMRQYTSRKQLFAFADSPVVISGSTRSVILYAYAEPDTAKAPATTSIIPSRGTAKPAADKVLRIQTNLESGTLDLLSNLEITFTAPLKNLDTSKLKLTNEVYERVQPVSYTLDSTRKKLTVQTNWIQSRGYHLMASKDFVEDTLGRKISRDDTLSFRTKSTNEYGSLKLRFLNLDLSKHPVLQFVRNNEVKYSHVFTDRNVNIKLFPPGEYDLRILYDENRNGKWDPGSFFGNRRQPEKVQPLARKLEVKPNWDSEVDITL